MRIGVPAEVKSDEYRVALTPAGALELTRRGHEVLVERGAGVGSGIPDAAWATLNESRSRGADTTSALPTPSRLSASRLSTPLYRQEILTD